MYLDKLKNISTFIFDIDGVLTDGNIYVNDDGVFSRSTSVKDGYAIVKALKAGFNVVVISGGNAEGVKMRLQRLGVKDVFLHVKSKTDVLSTWLDENNVKAEACLMMGDDEPDYQIMQKVGFSCCPSDAVDCIKKKVDFVSPYPGGKRCVRHIIETRLKLSNHW